MSLVPEMAVHFPTLSRARAFWMLQGSGWGMYVMVKGSAFPLSWQESLWIFGKGILLTSLLRRVLKSVERQHFAATVQITVSILAAFATTLVSLAASLSLARSGWVFQSPGSIAWLTSNEGLLFESLLYLSWTALYIGIVRGLDLQQERRKLVSALQRAERARALMLRYQLNPHFLFNALASLRGLVSVDAARAERVITDLSAFLRYSLIDSADEQSTLDREFDAVGRYLAIQKLRFEGRIAFDLDHDPALGNVRLPTFLIQPLVENAVKYGMHTCRNQPARIRVSASQHGSRCVLEVRNNGCWVDTDSPRPATLDRSGLGLSNLRERLSAQMHRDFTFTVGPLGNEVVARLDFEIA